MRSLPRQAFVSGPCQSRSRDIAGRRNNSREGPGGQGVRPLVPYHTGTQGTRGLTPCPLCPRPRIPGSEGPMSKVVYVSHTTIERKKGPLRIARLPGEKNPVMFSVHDEIAKHYGLDDTNLGDSHAATVDYVDPATGGLMLGPFGGAPEPRHIDAG